MLNLLSIAEAPDAHDPDLRWRPIATAPRDGLHILLAVKVGTGEGYFDGYDAAWLWAWGDPVDPAPTHWMRLPEPPEEA